MGKQRTTPYEDDNVLVTKRRNTGADCPAKWTLTFKDTDDYISLSREELFWVADALATVCNQIEDAEKGWDGGRPIERSSTQG